MFFYLHENKIPLNLEDNLNHLLELIPSYLNLSVEFKQFIKEKGYFFKLDKIIEIYLYFEQLFFELLYYKDEKELKKEKDNIDTTIIDIFNNYKLKDELIIAFRRYIMKYLIKNEKLSDFKNINLIKELYKSDLWGLKGMKKFDNIKNILDLNLKNVYIEIEKVYPLYELIKPKDTEKIEFRLDEEFEEEEGDDIINLNE